MNATHTILDDVKIYVGTYAKYNSGSLFGEWLTLSDYSDLGEFYNACRELHADEEDPEFMFQDFEAPEELRSKISECGIDADIFELAEDLDEFNTFDDMDIKRIHSEYDQDRQLFVFDDDFFNAFFCNNPIEAARAAYFGSLNWQDDYIFFNGDGNLESTSDIYYIIDRSEVFEYWRNNKSNF